MQACITATAMEADEVRKEELIESKIEEVVGDDQDNDEDGGSLQFLKPFLSGWQRVWSNSKKLFAAPGSTSEIVPDQPKILDVPDRPGEQQQTIEKDPGSTLQVKYRRMSLKWTGGRPTEGFPNARHSLGAMNLTPRREFDDRPLTQVHTQVNINLNFSLFSCKIVIRLV